MLTFASRPLPCLPLLCAYGVQRPEFVESFLHELLSRLHPRALAELSGVAEEKRRDVQREGGSGGGGGEGDSASAVAVHEWDAAYYMGRMKAGLFDLDDRALSHFFALQRCIDGVAVVFDRVFGCDMRRDGAGPWRGLDGGHRTTAGRARM